MNFEQWFQKWTWLKTRSGWYAGNNDDGDLQPYGWAVIPKRNGKFFIEAHTGAGKKLPLPYQEFDTLEAAQEWAGRYEWKRQEDFSKPFRNDEDYRIKF